MKRQWTTADVLHPGDVFFRGGFGYTVKTAEHVEITDGDHRTKVTVLDSGHTFYFREDTELEVLA